MTSLQQKTIIITGASAGVGEATARLCVAEGANVVIAARGKDALSAVAQRLGAQAFAVVADVANRDDCARLIQAALDRFGRIDGLVNNAGANVRGALDMVSLDDIERVIDVNLKAPMRLCKLVLPHLMAQGQGAIVNVASLAGRVPLDHEASYSASKFGLRGFSFALAEELRGSGISVSVVSPGPIETGFIMTAIDDVPDLVFSQPVNSADEVAAVILACLKDGKGERVMSAASNILTHIAYLFPSLRRALKPRLEAKGRKAKAKYKAAQGV